MYHSSTFYAEGNLRHPSRILVTGRSGSGKTTTVVDLINRVYRVLLGENGRLIVVSSTWYEQPLFNSIRDMVKSEKDVYIYPKKKMFVEILNKLKLETNLFREKGLPPLNSLILVDDFSGTNEIHSPHSGISNLSVMSNHQNLSMIVISQQPAQTCNAFRQNVNALIAYPPTSMAGFTMLFSEFNSNLMSKANFTKMCKKAWTGNKEDKSEYGQHFLFVYLPSRAPTRYFVDYTEEITPITYQKRAPLANGRDFTKKRQTIKKMLEMDEDE